ncbi:MAG: FHA domain-containing protein [Anaerolineales bacterium]|nr:FHA domain-containing protein [Anaerolineales bacterium]
MTKAWQVYYNAVFGAIGALIAWLLVGAIKTTSWNIHLANMFMGAGVGLFIGASLGLVDGLLVKRSIAPTVIGVLGGAAVGMFSGLVGLLLGGLGFVLIQGGLIARMLGWMALGAFLGLGQGLLGLQLKRALYGLAGGAVAGLIGGILYEILTQVFINQSEQVQLFLSAVGLVLIGVSLGVILPLSVSIIGGLLEQRSLVVYQSGPRSGTEVELIGSADLGSSDACQVYIQDRSVEKKQALIERAPKGFEIRNVGAQQTFWVNQRPVPPAVSVNLEQGAIIQMGDIRLRFQVY